MFQMAYLLLLLGAWVSPSSGSGPVHVARPGVVVLKLLCGASAVSLCGLAIAQIVYSQTGNDAVRCVLVLPSQRSQSHAAPPQFRARTATVWGWLVY